MNFRTFDLFKKKSDSTRPKPDVIVWREAGMDVLEAGEKQGIPVVNDKWIKE